MLDRFAIHQPRSVREASEMLAHYGADSAVYAGGTELLVVMKERLAQFPHLIDVKRISGLNAITYDPERREIAIGATTRHRDLERSPLVRQRLPALAALEAAVANIRVRSAGTIGGNLCFAEPHSDPATLLTALGARLALVSATGTREVPMADFVTGLMETVRRHDEILTTMTVPEPGPRTGVAYERIKLHERPTAAVAAVITVNEGTIVDARIVAGSVGDRPQRLPQTESFLIRQPVTGATAGAAGDLIRDEVVTIADAFESEAYKRQLARAVGRHAIAAAIARAPGTIYPPSPTAVGEGGRGVRASAGDGQGFSPDPLESAAPPMLLETTVNGLPVTLEIEPRAILLDVLRDRLGLTGAKRSCDTQVCGACTVLLDGDPVSACCTLAYEVDGRAVETIEGLAGPDGLHPIQQAFVDNVAIQCGFCTPGFVLTTKALLAENPRPTRAEIEGFLGGNLCRCTGYWNILKAVEDAAGALTQRLSPNDPHPNPSPCAQGEGLSPSPTAVGEGGRGVRDEGRAGEVP